MLERTPGRKSMTTRARRWVAVLNSLRLVHRNLAVDIVEGFFKVLCEEVPRKELSKSERCPSYSASSTCCGGSGVLLSRRPAPFATHAALAATTDGALPVVILRAGGGASATSFMAFAEDLAGRGSVAVGFDAPRSSCSQYNSAPGAAATYCRTDGPKLR
jgi:hypothetical protein